MENEFKKLNFHSAYSSLSKDKTLLSILIVVVIAALAGAGFLYVQYQNTAKELKKVKSQVSTQAGAAVRQDEAKKYVTELGKIVRLPDETPSIASITDASKLKDQAFFKDAKNGDVLLVFSKSGKVILYDPANKKIVDMTTLTGESAFTQQFKVTIRNGTKTAGLTNKIEEELKKVLGVVNVVSKENAAKDSYEKTTVAVLNPKAVDFAQNLAKALNAPVEDLPAGESKLSEADIIIIIGKDKI